MTTYSPDSSAITQIVYDEESGQAVVILKDGSSWTYNLPQDVMDAWMEASSAGGFYNANIRGQHAFFPS